MDEEKTRLRVKLGAAEIEYEGGTQFLKEEVMPKVDKILELVELRADLQRPIPIAQINGSPNVLPSSQVPVDDHSTSTIATLLDVKTTSELIIAAAAHLTLTQKKERFTRRDLLTEMKKASAFYKKSDRNNLTKTLEQLVKADRLRLSDGNTYALPAKTRHELEKMLADRQ